MFDDVKTAHFIGIGGIGMSAVAKLLLAKGVVVTGSDMFPSDITRDLEGRGVRVSIGHDAAHVPEAADLVVYSEAVPADNPERGVCARERSYADMLGELSRAYKTIVVTGTNGKSTTTAMLGRILMEAGMDPTVLVGSLVPSFALGNLHIGNGELLVIEGCEYRANMCKMRAAHAVITNIEEDHLDYYRDLAHIRETFQGFIDGVDGRVLLNAGNAPSDGLEASHPVRFGYECEADYMMRERRFSPGFQSANAYARHPESLLGKLVLRVPGVYNLENALAATAMAMELGVPFDTCARALATYSGIWRRFERVGEADGATVISDYAHHPTALKDVLTAAREFFPDARIVLCFQPHQHSRTKELKQDFIQALCEEAPDIAVIPEIYGVVGRTEAEAREVSSRDLVEGVKEKAPGQDIRFAVDLENAEKMLREVIKSGDIMLVMGAGDVDLIARSLVTEHARPRERRISAFITSVVNAFRKI